MKASGDIMSGSTNPECAFCHLAPARVVDENELAVSLADGYPVSPGHTLIIPRRHVADFFELSPAELGAVFEMVFRMRSRLASEHQPDGFNVGINVGAAAGQTVMHAHVHIIPRFVGDTAEPEGGVRNVISGKGRYR
jgi:diadenosine tetraphosphate (Ap4A) HIT family hydrolase